MPLFSQITSPVSADFCDTCAEKIEKRDNVSRAETRSVRRLTLIRVLSECPIKHHGSLLASPVTPRLLGRANGYSSRHKNYTGRATSLLSFPSSCKITAFIRVVHDCVLSRSGYDRLYSLIVAPKAMRHILLAPRRFQDKGGSLVLLRARSNGSPEVLHWASRAQVLPRQHIPTSSSSRLSRQSGNG